MKKSSLLLLVSLAIVGGSMPAYAQAQPAASDNKIVGGFKTLGRGIMWGPKKLWTGMQAAGKKISGKS